MSKCHVLMYHKVNQSDRIPNRAGTVSAEKFEKQVEYLKKNFKILSLNDLLFRLINQKDLPAKSVLLTFDDGQADFYQYAFSILKKYQIPATLFLTTSFIGSNQPFWWDELETYLLKTKLREFIFHGQRFNLSNTERVFNKLALIIKDFPLPKRGEVLNQIREALEVKDFSLERSTLTWDEIKELAKNDISFGAHTHNHVNLAKTNLNEAKDEISSSKKIIEEKLGKQVEAFAYPHGGIDDFNEDHEKMLKELGFKIAFTTIENSIIRDSNPFRLGRIAISGADNFLIFKAKVKGINPIFLKVLRKLL